MLINAVAALAALLILGAIFGAAGAHVRRRFGPGALLPLSVCLAAVVAGAMTVRGNRLERGMRYQPWTQHPLWMLGLYTAFLLVTLTPAAVMLGRAAERPTGASARRAALLVLPGLVLAVLALLALDISGVEFLPPG